MKIFIVFTFLLASSSVFGATTKESLFSLVEGQGTTIEEAWASVQTKLPLGWTVNLDEDPLIECSQAQAKLNAENCDFTTTLEFTRVTVPILKNQIQKN